MPMPYVALHIMKWTDLRGPDQMKIDPHPAMGSGFLPVFESLTEAEEWFPNTPIALVKDQELTP